MEQEKLPEADGQQSPVKKKVYDRIAAMLAQLNVGEICPEPDIQTNFMNVNINPPGQSETNQSRRSQR